MTESIYEMLAIALSCLIGLAFVRVKTVHMALFSFATGIICALCSYALRVMNVEQLNLILQATIYIVAMLLTRFLLRIPWDETLIACFVSLGAFAVLVIPYSMIIWIKLGTIILFLVMLIIFREYFPEKGWQEDLKEGEFAIWVGHASMYILPIFICLLFWLAIVLGINKSLYLIAVECILYWLMISILVMIPAYAQKQTAVTAEQQYRGEIQNFLNVIRSQRHDYNFHVQTISGLIKQGKIEECLKYINALEEDSAIMNSILPVKDPAISALIHNFQTMAVKEGIRLNIDIRYDLSQIATNVYETNKIISNLLQNAIDETIMHEDKSYGIWLSILKRGEFCVISVSNSVLKTPSGQEIGDIYNQGYTTKSGHDGVGLSSLRTLVSKYHGAIYTETEGDIIKFVARIPIDYAKKTTE